MIYEGAVDILILDSTSSSMNATIYNDDRICRNSKIISTLKAGEGFGELALVNDGLRGATVVTKTPCLVLKLEKDNYGHIIRKLHDQQVKEKLQFLRKLSFAHELLDVPSLALTMVMRSYAPMKVILHEGEPVQYIYLIRSGQIQAYIHLACAESRTAPSKQQKIPLGLLGPGEYFGEDALVRLQLERFQETTEFKSRIGFKCLEEASVGLITLHDAQKSFPRDFPLSRFSLLVDKDKDLKDHVAMYQDQLKWNHYKKRFMDSFYKEKCKDPGMTVEKFQNKSVYQPFK